MIAAKTRPRGDGESGEDWIEKKWTSRRSREVEKK